MVSCGDGSSDVDRTLIPREGCLGSIACWERILEGSINDHYFMNIFEIFYACVVWIIR